MSAAERRLELQSLALEATLGDAVAEAERRLLQATEAAERRIAAADRAQQREEDVRRRIEVAEAASERRVRAAERRLAEVLADLSLPGDRGQPSAPE